MAYNSFIVGFAEDDPRRFYHSDFGVLAGRCGSCRRNTYLAPSGVEALRTRDSAVYCADCAIGRKEYDSMVADLSL